jgi:hypothetical protein
MCCGESFPHKIVLRFEVSVETAVGQPGISHQAGDARALDPFFSKLCRCYVNYPFARLVFVALLITHAGFPQ